MVSPLDALVARARDLADDLKLERVREWKAARPGRIAIGCLPVWTPRELIHAAGGLAVGVRGGGDGVEVVRGDAYFQSYICQLPRSTLELLLDGSLDPLDGMVFPSTCDVIRNLSGMWQLLRPGMFVKYLDVPQSFRPDLGGEFFERELRELRTDLARLAGRTITDDDLRASIDVCNAQRRALEELYALRKERPWLVPTSELYLLLRAGDVLPPEEHTAMLLEYRDLARASNRPVEDQARVTLTGTFCERPPLGLIQTIERSGCAIVDDDLALGLRFIRGDVDPSGDPLAALARAFLTQGRRCQTMFLPDRCEQKGAALVEDARRAGAEGVIFAAASFCDPALLDQPMTAKAVEAAGLPSTSFKYAENTGQFQPIREQTGAFADTIKIWSDA